MSDMSITVKLSLHVFDCNISKNENQGSKGHGRYFLIVVI